MKLGWTGHAESSASQPAPLVPGPAGYRYQWNAAVLVIFQYRAQALSKRGVGTPNHAIRLRDLRRYCGRNMRLGAYGIRELHWHQQAEWAIMLDGKCRITVLDELGREIGRASCRERV